MELDDPEVNFTLFRFKIKNGNLQSSPQIKKYNLRTSILCTNKFLIKIF